MSISAMDPNENWGEKTVRVKFACWDYTAEVETSVGGNTLGFNVLETAIGAICHELPQNQYGMARIILKRESDGDELICDDEEDRGDDWLAGMVVAAEITAIRPTKAGVTR